MDYNKKFKNIMFKANNPMEGAKDIFNEVSYERSFEHRALKDDGSGGYISDDGEWSPETVSDIIDELEYWYSLYFEEGHIRHDEEFKERHLLKKAIDFLEPYA